MHLSDVRRSWALHEAELAARLERYVRTESGSDDKAKVDSAAEVFAAELRALGFAPTIIENPDGGNHVVGDRAGSGSGHVVLLLHLDTVWPGRTYPAPVFRIEDGRAMGPGVLDMKGGWVVALAALEHLFRDGWDGPRRLTVIATGDEELGSTHGRRIVEEHAAGADFALVMEPGRADGSLVGRRGAVGALRISVTGRNSHASSDDPGASALIAAAHMAIALEAASDRPGGRILNVGELHAGTARQVVPAHAELNIDLRAATGPDAARLLEHVAKVSSRPAVPGVEARVRGGITRPAYPADLALAPLQDAVRRAGTSIGLPVRFVTTRGGSDGNFTAAMGIPTVDGLGADGGGICTADEYVDLGALPGKIALLCGILDQLAGTGRFDLDASTAADASQGGAK
ncbi:Carboxypeptidase G2 precursor [Arthrobacter saudimassiliensis]|uniref:Carboxypeptidase G2 n=1 Tax=Arthrobacter saudimassiliensis TaxID=1461584 RepID=A0A078MWE6_9MICC|nr:Carboxypeptidase G2 precursor [Arthrobacter saudimassiliensis]